MKILYSSLVVALIFLVSGCNQAEVERLKSEKADLQSAIHELEEQSALKDSTINDFFNSFNEIESNLAMIREKEKNIKSQRLGNGEVRKDVKEQIISDITDINELLAENRDRINNLNDNLRKANINSRRFQEMIAGLEQRVSEKNEEITTLRTNLANANTALSALNDLYIESVLDNEAKEEELNTAFYAFGTYKELKENGVLTKEGGIIGLGSAKTLRKDFNRGYFKKIDIRQKTDLDLYSEKARIITTHPPESYELATVDGAYQLQIKKPDVFWSASKYLVVVTD